MIVLSVDDIVKKISEKTGLDEVELLEKVKAKRIELKDLITLEGAAHIIAGELGINLLEGVVEIPKLKIENVIPGMSSVDVVGRLSRLFEVRTFEKSDSVKGKVVSGIISDKTASLRIVFWDDKAELVEQNKLKEGDIIKIHDGYSRETLNGEPEIHVGNRTQVIVNPDDIIPEDFPATGDMTKKISELSDGMQGVDVSLKVLRVYDPRSFDREDSSTGKVVNLLVADETKRARLVLWDDDVGLVEKGEIKEGDILKIKRGYVRQRLEELEIHVGKYGKVILNPSDVTLEDIDTSDVSTVKRTDVSDLKEGMRAEVIGALVRVYDNPTIYEKDGEKRFVVNGVIDDGTGRVHTVFFNKMGELLLETTINALIEGDPRLIVEERSAQILGKDITAAGNVRKNDQSQRLELIVFDLDLNPDPIKEIERLLKEAETLAEH